jgi:hypothetical protein
MMKLKDLEVGDIFSFVNSNRYYDNTDTQYMLVHNTTTGAIEYVDLELGSVWEIMTHYNDFEVNRQARKTMRDM